MNEVPEYREQVGILPVRSMCDGQTDVRDHQHPALVAQPGMRHDAAGNETRLARAHRSEVSGAGALAPGRLGHHASVPEDDDMLARQLDADFAGWASTLTPAQHAALKQWQQSDRFYERIQRILRTGVDDEEADEVLDAILEAIDAGALAREVVAWRGIRNTATAFGRSNQDLAGLVHQEIPQDGLLPVSISKAVALAEFTDPSFGGGPALLRVTIPSRTPAAWLPLVGDPALRYQCELLLGPGHALHLSNVDYAGGGLPVLDVEVI